VDARHKAGHDAESVVQILKLARLRGLGQFPSFRIKEISTLT
jgi:hypothetical protein